MDSQRTWSTRSSTAAMDPGPSSQLRRKAESFPVSAPVGRQSAPWNFLQVPIHSAAKREGSGSPLRLQAKLEVGAVDSPLEREADQVASQVMQGSAADGVSARSGGSQIQRKCDGCKQEDETEKKVSRAPSAPSASSFDGMVAPPSVNEALQTAGRPLDGASQQFMQTRFGHDFSKVRIHADEQAAQSAEAIRARAYTVGESVVFARGQFAPDTEDGRGLLAHELVHVLQQREVRPAAQGTRPNAAKAAEGSTHEGSATVGAESSRGLASRAMVQRSPGDGRGQGSSPLLSSGPQLTLGGHSIAGDQQAVDRLLQGELTVGRYLQPTYLGSPMTLDAVVNLLKAIAPTLSEGELRGRVQFQWTQKLAATPRLPALYDSPVTVSLNPDAPSRAGGGAGAGGAGGGATTQPSGPAPSGLPDMAGGSSPQGPSGAGGGGSWSPSLGPQVTVNLVRGSGPPVDSAMQRQYALGDNIQVLFQDSNDSGTGAYQVVAGGQAATPNLIHSTIVKLQPFIQLVAGFSAVPGVTSASMLVQVSFGAQVSFAFGPITLQLSAAIQQTAQQGQPLQSAAAFSATLGPTNPAGNSGMQNSGNWYLGVAPPPPLPGPAGGPSGYPAAGGGMFIFGGRF